MSCGTVSMPPEGLVEVVLEITDLDRLRALLRRAATCADVDQFANEL